MTMMSTGGLMIISQFAAFSRDFGVANVVVFGLAALPLALTIDRLTNGLTRPFFGFVSDRIGRENTMAIAFLMEAAAVTLMVMFRGNAAVFVILSGVVFFGWGEIFSLFPSTLTDTFGVQARHHQLRMALCRAGRRLDPRRPAGGACCASRPEAGCRCLPSSSRWTR